MLIFFPLFLLMLLFTHNVFGNLDKKGSGQSNNNSGRNNNSEAAPKPTPPTPVVPARVLSPLEATAHRHAPDSVFEVR
jgi:hypothetical protein